jgi:hypothetical protein
MDDLIKAAEENNMDIIARSFHFSGAMNLETVLWPDFKIRLKFSIDPFTSNRCLFKCDRSRRHELLVFSCFQKNLEQNDVEPEFFVVFGSNKMGNCVPKIIAIHRTRFTFSFPIGCVEFRHVEVNFFALPNT